MCQIKQAPLVKISASGPIPTSKYCEPQSLFQSIALFKADAACSDRQVESRIRLLPITSCTDARIAQLLQVYHPLAPSVNNTFNHAGGKT